MDSSKQKELKISAIGYGTVLDHIPSNRTFKVAEILNLNEHEDIISIATNLPSKKLGKKGIIKIAGKIISKEQVDKIAIVAPNATVNLIKDYNVDKKEKVEIQDILDNLVKCSNPKCITNNEVVKTKFYVLKKSPLIVRGHYCERLMQSDEIVLK